MTADARDRLRQLTEAHQKATAGPWTAEPNFTGGWAVARAKIEDANGTPVHTPSGWTPYDAAAIVAAHNAVPWLVAALTAVLDLIEAADAKVRQSVPAAGAEALIREGAHTVKVADLRAVVAAAGGEGE